VEGVHPNLLCKSHAWAVRYTPRCGGSGKKSGIIFVKLFFSGKNMRTITTKRIENLRAAIRASQAEMTIRIRVKNAADKSLAKVERNINEKESKLNEYLNKLEKAQR
jgi:hypothetical protein